MDRWTLVLTGMASALGLMTLVWIASVIRRDASLVDRAWGLVFVLLAGVYLVGAEDPTPRSYLAAALVTIWGVRLSVYLTWRNWGEGEDWRYGMMRERYPKRFALTSLVTIFWGQGLAAVGVGTPLLAAVRDGQPESLGWLDGVGVAVWIVGFVFEAVATGSWRSSRATR